MTDVVTPDMTDAAESLGSDDASVRAELATDIYEALRAVRKLSSHRVLAYRCATPARCLLLDVLLLPQGHLIAQPRHKVSPARNAATSNEDGRRLHTEDGDRRWKAQAYFAIDARGFSLTCDHVAEHWLQQEALDEDLEAGHDLVTVPPHP